MQTAIKQSDVFPEPSGQGSLTARLETLDEGGSRCELCGS